VSDNIFTTLRDMANNGDSYTSIGVGREQAQQIVTRMDMQRDVLNARYARISDLWEKLCERSEQLIQKDREIAAYHQCAVEDAETIERLQRQLNQPLVVNATTVVSVTRAEA
jgi:uncharacterized protein (DUF3084 family)